MDELLPAAVRPVHALRAASGGQATGRGLQWRLATCAPKGAQVLQRSGSTNPSSGPVRRSGSAGHLGGPVYLRLEEMEGTVAVAGPSDRHSSGTQYPRQPAGTS